ncbi:hypothetical protein TREMEDRAFT_58037 [Tremella mesenterica DSM 1558]|uniref:uncharacterized protein n=1 Tax=Tremella mesenterica (strain ATCC 24925 / CBS 8224 / DSM 1558 / NBRC 9311 / NRRL Y-6157 / RJB 2259-6 / UBC 559-6) TaxID=578456 RepID=UPI0003F48C8B|nr:uncharacterized protein TREMEDRAFT_58037 [Tremella mesenterica DSM 1558]EIW71904.1 hypothetical protein TREMEDRAFT_58037 [Tremella mesenterica DSM 1558]
MISSQQDIAGPFTSEQTRMLTTWTLHKLRDESPLMRDKLATHAFVVRSQTFEPLTPGPFLRWVGPAIKLERGDEISESEDKSNVEALHRGIQFTLRMCSILHRETKKSWEDYLKDTAPYAQTCSTALVALLQTGEPTGYKLYPMLEVMDLILCEAQGVGSHNREHWIQWMDQAASLLVRNSKFIPAPLREMLESEVNRFSTYIDWARQCPIQRFQSFDKSVSKDPSADGSYVSEEDIFTIRISYASQLLGA